jgi:predicted permease
MLRTFAHLNSVDPGFRGEHVLTMRTALPQPRYRGIPARSAFYLPVLERIQALPGVVDAGFTSWLPYRNYGGTSAFVIEGRAALPTGQDNDANIRLVTPGYPSAMGMTLLEGRLLTAADHAGTEPVAVINRTMSRQFWPAENPLDQRLRICQDCPWFRVVGIVGDIHQMALDVDVRPEYFVPFDQLPQAISFAPPQDLAIRVAGDAEALLPDIRRAIWSVDSQQPIAQVRILSDYLREDLAPRRFQTQLIGTFAGLALLLSSLGIYGVLSYVVSQRRREIGVRMALGADSGEVIRLITGQGMRPALTGLAIGFVVAYGLAHLISVLLAGVEPRDPITFAAAAAVLLATAFLASWIPARRAARVDPGSVLHYE